MDFCDTKCLFCTNIGIRTINVPGYHKICQDHLNSINDFMQTICIHCSSKVFILKEFIFCCSCNKKECQNQSCKSSGISVGKNNSEQEIVIFASNNKDIVDILPEDGPEKSSCKKCHSITEKTSCLECNKKFCSKCQPFEKYCSYCLNNINDCDNCGKIGMLIALKCSHFGCYNCKDQNFCRNCDSSKIVKCNHEKCLKNIEKPCTICDSESLSFICQYCNKKTNKLKKIKCSHELCEQCLNENIYKKENNDMICMKCYSILLDFNEVQIAEEHKKVNSLSQKLPENIKKTQEGIKKKCCFCRKKCKNSLKIDCEHFMCQSCINLKKNCQICPINNMCSYCNISGLKLVFLKCQHPMCKMCVKQNKKCKNCNPKRCYKCKKEKSSVFGDCGHRLCTQCFENDSKCNECNKKHKIFCRNCGEKSKKNLNLKCKHIGCIKCEKNDICYNCVKNVNTNNEIIKTEKECSFCKIVTNKYYYLRCEHTVCTKCLKKNNYNMRNLNYSCLSCISKGNLYYQICSFCHNRTNWLIEKKSLIRVCCNKEVCIKCLSIINKQNHTC
ncbi:hypothetical protein SteCoe_9676 [Stentor coeruleus]|uniref:RING-type domain-containing protein n=1 Tax=Stentor coeruleus TaxID=5963 RepID=A0A1R2CHC8_9CILI|nr:hypothetical protein SteCoe_9676 [Stentor coeruleus]